MTIGVDTHVTTIRLQLSERRPRSNLSAIGAQLEAVDSLVTVAAWSDAVKGRDSLELEEHVRYSALANYAARNFLVENLSYNSPLLIAISGVASGASAVGYAIYRLYSAALKLGKQSQELRLGGQELRKKISDTDLHALINEQIMEDLRFSQQQKRIMRLATDGFMFPPGGTTQGSKASREEFARELPPDVPPETAIRLARTLDQASSAIVQAESIEVEG